MTGLDTAFPYRSQRPLLHAANVVATSQPLAAQAGLRMLYQGGNAVDAALAAAITTTVVEPTGSGLGGDAFAIVWDGQQLHGLNASGYSPAAWEPERFAGLDKMPARGWDSVTIPGVVAGWQQLWQRLGSLPFAQLFEPAIDYARHGFVVSPIIAGLWQAIVPKYQDQPGFQAAFMPQGRAPRAGERFAHPALAASLEKIAATEGADFYQGELAAAMLRHSAAHGGVMSRDDLADYAPEWCGTISQRIADVDVHEIPPNTQGLATLIALGVLQQLDITRYGPDSVEAIHLQIEAMKLGFADVHAYVGDPAQASVTPADMLSPAYLQRRAAEIDPHRAQEYAAGAPQHGGTVYIAAADQQGMMVSFIQSNYEGFGSGVVVPDTGISMQNRGMGFDLRPEHPNYVGPRKRPFHTIIPGFSMRDDGPDMAFGVMGGPMQAQGHVQMVVRTHLYGQNPQAAIDAPRWQVSQGKNVMLEPSMPAEVVAGLAARGHQVQQNQGGNAAFAFGGAQIIMRGPHGYLAGSDARKDGLALGY